MASVSWPRPTATRHYAYPVDLLLADIVMPGLDGVQLARKAKQMHPGIKVLFITGYA